MQACGTQQAGPDPGLGGAGFRQQRSTLDLDFFFFEGVKIMFNDSIIVVPWDFSEQSKCALDLALEKASPKNVHVICVLERPEPYTLQWGEEREARALEKCEEQFWEKTGQNKESGLRFKAEFGTAAEEIVGFARSRNAGLILMSTHGRNALERLVMGSVAKRVTQTASCPVLLLPNTWCNSYLSDHGRHAKANPGNGSRA